MKLFFKHNGLYLFIYLVALAILGYILLHHDKVQIHLVINAWVGNPVWDTFFKYITHVGDGLFASLVIMALLFVSLRKSLYILVSYAGAALISSFFKYFLYPNTFRPYSTFGYFLPETKLNIVEGVEMVSIRSFPSGHALSAFSLFFCLIFMTKNQALKALFCVLAFVSSFSRLYLSQHWLIDVYVGSLIGVGFSLLFYAVFYNTSRFSYLDTTLPKLISENKQKRV
ncbi:MAG: phosphatase PAP2 family protein [Bacteroidota bacterium]